ncbi:MAG: DUF2283 domain-containing protein [Candidatus Heimdallarchaeota archaeon]
MVNKVKISYDNEADVMYLSFGDPKKAESEDIAPGLFARYNPETGDLVGVTVINFLKKPALREGITITAPF